VDPFENDAEMKDGDDEEDIYGETPVADSATATVGTEQPPLPVQEMDLDLDFEPRAVSAKEQTLMDIVFRVADSLGAYMPDPKTDEEFFKRVLKNIRLAQVSEDFSWYPWGAPPMSKIVDALKTTDDEDLREICANIVLLFQQHVGAVSPPPAADDKKND